MAVTPTGSVETCSDDECDGEFLFDDGVTLYDHATSGITLEHSDPASRCLVAVYDYFLDDPVLAGVDCNALRYTICQCSLFNF